MIPFLTAGRRVILLAAASMTALSIVKTKGVTNADVMIADPTATDICLKLKSLSEELLIEEGEDII
jgi:hypothetical protein